MNRLLKQIKNKANSLLEFIFRTEKDIETFPAKEHLVLMILGLLIGFLIVLYSKIKS